MPTPFPGMDPYLEQKRLWEQVHTALLVVIQQHLIPLLRPKYRVGIEERVYLDYAPLSPEDAVWAESLLKPVRPT